MRLPATERRQAIISAAVRLFSQKGFRGTTTRELASAVGVSEPVIYQHFKTKRELYEAIIESKSKVVDGDLGLWAETACGAKEPANDREAFLALARMIWRWHEQDRELARLLQFSALEGNELADMFFARHAQGFIEQVSNRIRARMEAKAFRDGNADLLAWLFIGMVGHYAESVSVFGFDPVTTDHEEVIAVSVDVFLRGVLNVEKNSEEKRKSAGAGAAAAAGGGGSGRVLLETRSQGGRSTKGSRGSAKSR